MCEKLYDGLFWLLVWSTFVLTIDSDILGNKDLLDVIIERLSK